MGQRVFSSADASDLAIDVHLGVFDILKARTHAATIPALACVKRHCFSIFRFAVGEIKVLGDLFLMMVFHRRSKRVKIFSATFLTSTFISVIVIH